MYLRFAWRYFKAKKSTNAINIIAWVTTGVIAFAVCCQVLVLSVFNGLEDLVKSLYSSFYSDLKIVPASGKTFHLTSTQLQQIKNSQGVKSISLNIEGKALLENGDIQSVIQLKGVDQQYNFVSGLPAKVYKGHFDLGDVDHPKIVVGAGVQNATNITLDEAFGPEQLVVILPHAEVKGSDPMESLSEGHVQPSGVFSIQQDFDNQYAITNIEFVRQQTGLNEDNYSAAEISLLPNTDIETVQSSLQQTLGNKFRVLTRYEQNMNLYSTMKMEKWMIYGILTLILIIAAFNMIGALTMLVLEKKHDISILNSMGARQSQIKTIFLSEGLLLGGIGAGIGLLMAYTICLLQMKFKLIKISGSSFIIDYFPVKLLTSDLVLVTATVMLIVSIASWLPAKKASAEALNLK